MELREREFHCDTSRDGNDCWISETWVGLPEMKAVVQRTVASGWCESDDTRTHTKPNDEMPEQVIGWFKSWGIELEKPDPERPQPERVDTLLAMLKPPVWGEVSRSRIMWFTPLDTVYMIQEGAKPSSWFLSKDNKNHRDYGSIEKCRHVAWDDYYRCARELLKKMLVE